MPEFQYQAKQGPEKLVTGVIDAPTESAAIEKISQRGFVPIKITLLEKTGREIAPVPTVVGFKTKPNFSRIYLFSSHLSRLLKAGVPVLKAVHLLASHEKDKKIRVVLESIEREVREGKTLSRAMELFPEVFPPMYLAVIHAGEVSGGLQEALIQLSIYFKKQEELASKIRRAMAYPTVLALAGIASIFFIVTFLVPRLEKVFVGLGHELPWPTQVVLKFGWFMQHYWFVAILAIAAMVFFLPRVFRSLFGKDFFDALKLRIPLLGDFIVKVEFARFSRTLGLSFANGLPFLEALRVGIPAVNNAWMRQALEECYEGVEKGASFGQTLKKFPLFSGLMANLVSIGEESGRVDETLVEIADVYEQEIDEFLLYSTTLLEPLMILCVGSVIGFIVMAVLLPIFEMNTLF